MCKEHSIESGNDWNVSQNHARKHFCMLFLWKLHLNTEEQNLPRRQFYKIIQTWHTCGSDHKNWLVRISVALDTFQVKERCYYSEYNYPHPKWWKAQDCSVSIRKMQCLSADPLSARRVTEFNKIPTTYTRFISVCPLLPPFHIHWEPVNLTSFEIWSFQIQITCEVVLDAGGPDTMIGVLMRRESGHRHTLKEDNNVMAEADFGVATTTPKEC